MTLSTQGFDGFVASTAARIATGWKTTKLTGWDLHPLKNHTFHGARRDAESSERSASQSSTPNGQCDALRFGNPPRRGVRREKVWFFSGCKSHPASLVVFQPVAIQAAVEATKPSEPWVERVMK
jgi:hypothetical protein